MLTEFCLTQNSNSVKKRWFQDDYFDLFTWQDNTGRIINFQLCYDRQGNEHVILWDFEKGFGHYRIDDGESSPHKNMSPVFVSNGFFLHSEVKIKFLKSSRHITQDIGTFIIEKLDEYYRNH